MKPITLERLMQHLLPMPNDSMICVRNNVTTAFGTLLSVQAIAFTLFDVSHLLAIMLRAL